MRHKYRNVPTVVDGIKFASKKEAARYQQLALMQKLGTIRGLECHPSYDLVVGGLKICRYVGDFRYWNVAPAGSDWEYRYPVVEDVKGVKTPIYRLKKKLMFALHGVEVLEV